MPAAAQPPVADADAPEVVSRSAPPVFERRAGGAVAFMASLVLHVTLMLILACWAYRVGQDSQGLLLTAERGESAKSTLDLVQTFEIAPQHSEAQSAVEQPVVALSWDFEMQESQPQSGAGTGLVGTLTSTSVGQVIETLDVQGGRGASFFGTYAEGNRFVYVLDSSQSMSGDRWTYACNQLIDSLNALKPGQEFFIICFDQQTSFLFNRAPPRAAYFQADRETIAKVRRWLRGRTLGKATMPASALQAGIAFNPDAIFMLSDGELQDNTLSMLRSINGFRSERRQIPIHTVHLFSPAGRRSLELIAMENGGKFTHIDGH